MCVDDLWDTACVHEVNYYKCPLLYPGISSIELGELRVCSSSVRNCFEAIVCAAILAAWQITAISLVELDHFTVQAYHIALFNDTFQNYGFCLGFGFRPARLLQL